VERDNDDTETDEPETGTTDAESKDDGPTADSSDGAKGDDADGGIADDVDVDVDVDDDDDYDDYEDARDELLLQIAKDTATTKILAAIAVGVLVVGMIGLGFLVRANENDDTTKSASVASSTPSTVPQAESVAGKPCVAVVGPLPAGAPQFDVVVGPAPTSLVVNDIKEGTGATVAATDSVTLNYVGVACTTGEVFDSSYKTGAAAPAPITLSNVIPGLAQGITGMKVGGQRVIGIPSDLAFGSQGVAPAIAPDEAIWFFIEVVSTTPGA